MNFSQDMVPGLSALLIGALLTFFAGKLCHREKDVPRIKMLGVILAALGAIFIFLP